MTIYTNVLGHDYDGSEPSFCTTGTWRVWDRKRGLWLNYWALADLVNAGRHPAGGWQSNEVGVPSTSWAKNNMPSQYFGVGTGTDPRLINPSKDPITPEQMIAGVGIVINDNGDGTVTITATGGGGGGITPIAGDGIDITDNGDGTATFAVDTTVLQVADVTGGDGVTITDNGDGTITIDAAGLTYSGAGGVTITDNGDGTGVIGTDNTVLHLTDVIAGTDITITDNLDGTVTINATSGGSDEWQTYAESIGVIATAVSGKSFPRGSVVQMKTVSPTQPATDPRFPSWNLFEVDELTPEAAFDLPEAPQGRIYPIANASYTNKLLNVSGMGIAIQYQVFDYTPTYGSVGWQLDSLHAEGNLNTDDKKNPMFEIRADNVGAPGAVLVANTDIDHTEMAISTSQNHILPLNTPLVLANGQKFWVVSRFDIRDTVTYPGEASTRVQTYGVFPLVPTDWDNFSEAVFVDIVPGSAKYTVDDGTNWSDEPESKIPRIRVNVTRTTGLEPPTSVYGVMLNAVDDVTEVGCVLHGAVRGDMSGASIGETWANKDLLYWNPITNALTNVKPANPLDVITLGQVFDNNAVDGVMMVTAISSASRGIYMNSAVYDPQGKRTDAFNLAFMSGTTQAWRSLYDNSLGDIAAADVQAALDEIGARLTVLEP